jgi:hypothetical protein
MADEMSVSLPEGVLRPIIQAQVVAALQGQDRLMGEMVAFVLTQKVRDQSAYKDYPFLEFTARQLIKEAVEAAVREWVASQHGAIKAAVEKQLRGQVKGMASRLVTSLVEGSEKTWKLRIGVAFDEN